MTPAASSAATGGGRPGIEAAGGGAGRFDGPRPTPITRGPTTFRGLVVVLYDSLGQARRVERPGGGDARPHGGRLTARLRERARPAGRAGVRLVAFGLLRRGGARPCVSFRRSSRRLRPSSLPGSSNRGGYIVRGLEANAASISPGPWSSSPGAPIPGTTPETVPNLRRVDLGVRHGLDGLARAWA